MALEASSDLLIGQWLDSPRIRAMVESFLDLLRDQAIPATERLRAMHDLDEAEGVFLDALGKIIGLERPSTADPTLDRRWGFDLAGEPWDTVPYRGSAVSDAQYALPDSTYRRFLRAKVVLNGGDGTLATFTEAVRQIDPGAAVADGRKMSVTVTTTQEEIMTLADDIGALPRPAGVEIAYSPPVVPPPPALSAPVFAGGVGTAQDWTQGVPITPISVPAADGNPAPTYAVVGALPAGIVFDAMTRVISGTPTATGSGTITVRATNSEGDDDWMVFYTTAAPSFGLQSFDRSGLDLLADNEGTPFLALLVASIPGEDIYNGLNMVGELLDGSLRLDAESEIGVLRVRDSGERVVMRRDGTVVLDDFLEALFPDAILHIQTLDGVTSAPYASGSSTWAHFNPMGTPAIPDGLADGDRFIIAISYTP